MGNLIAPGIPLLTLWKTQWYDCQSTIKATMKNIAKLISSTIADETTSIQQKYNKTARIFK